MNRAFSTLVTANLKRVPLYFRFSRSVFVPQTQYLWKTYSTQEKKISIDVIKEFRKLTDAPLGKCKKALEENVRRYLTNFILNRMEILKKQLNGLENMVLKLHKKRVVERHHLELLALQFSKMKV